MSYESLRFIPRLNGVSIIGDKIFSDFGLVNMSSSCITEIFKEIYGYVL
jgi:hypothetical protein